MITFVVSSGRSGTKSAAAHLAKQPGTDAYHGPAAADEERDNLRRRLGESVPWSVPARMAESLDLRRDYVEVSWCLAASIGAVRAAAAGCRVIHLVRHPYGFVRSGLVRPWFTGNDEYRASVSACSRDHWPVRESSSSRERLIAAVWVDQQRCIRESAVDAVWRLEVNAPFAFAEHLNASRTEPLSEMQRRMIWDVAGEEAARYGYSA